MITADLCRDVAVEAVRRGSTSNVHELWALLEAIDSWRPSLIVDVGSGPAEWWAWWSLCPSVIGASRTSVEVQPAFNGSTLPAGVTALTGEPIDASTALRVSDQVARRPVDVLIIAGARSGDDVRFMWERYAGMVGDGGRVVVQGIAASPEIARFWGGLTVARTAVEKQELIGAVSPVGYGIVTIPGKASSNG